MLDQVRTRIEDSAALKSLLASISGASSGSCIPTGGMSGSLLAFVLSSLSDSLGSQILAVAPDRAHAEELADDLALIHGYVSGLFSTSRHHLLSPTGLVGTEGIAALQSLLDSTTSIVVVSAESLPLSLPHPQSFRSNTITIAQGSDGSLTQLAQRLSGIGFERRDFVGTPGEFSVRGGVLDIFSFASKCPIRCEFLGDTVESIREFDPLSQRSIREIASTHIIPNLHHPGDSQPKGSGGQSIVHYLKPKAVLVFIEPEVVWDRVEEECAAQAEQTTDLKQLRHAVSQFIRVEHSILARPGQRIEFNSSSQPSFNGNIRLLRNHILGLVRDGVQVTIACDGQTELKRLRELMIEARELEDTPPDGELLRFENDLAELDKVVYVHPAIHSGFVLPEVRLACYTEHQVFGRQKRRGVKRKPRFRGFSAKELHQLQNGDFVVHQDFGIGRFAGLKRIRVRAVEQEVMKLLYGEGDTLYVNLNYLGKVQKYSSKDGHIPKLTRLGTQEWDKLKARAKKKIQDIARDLIRVYARRKGSAGYAFQIDTTWQKELEASFVYEDTFDQARATLEVKQDMEQPFPMDRLVCGDVGFGKTEVAVRAAFKSALEGKQVAVLVPTTILAIQHFNTFVDRTSRYPVCVAVISRLRSKREQAEILGQLKAGTIDIIIGTHRLLSKDVHFKDLGLLIVDEEHRFGVAAKEKLRQLKAAVDTLTLTATPIPRTLHFSLMGARDLSIIATPPRNRLPIITEVSPYDDQLVREAVLRETRRGGQVYFVHDRINDIGKWAQNLQAVLPSVRMRIAHGQLPAHELEKVMLEFQEKKLDMLVCTKIIESGLDIPNVNTIIVNRADRFGMSELYQLRGRVGRSNIQAYAYLLVPPITSLPTATIQRLQAVEEFTELGSGFNLAMRDLEIRGAGNLLGAEQSGFIESMGFETYTRVLDEAVTELKEQEFRELFPQEEGRKGPAPETVVDVDFEALIPSSYIENDSERLEMYRRMYGVTTEAQLEELSEDIKDRFGPHPVEVQNLFATVRVRLVGAELGFRRIAIGTESFDIEFPQKGETSYYESRDFQVLMTEISRWRERKVMMKQDGRALMLSARFLKNENAIPTTLQFLRGLRDLLHRTAPAST